MQTLQVRRLIETIYMKLEDRLLPGVIFSPLCVSEFRFTRKLEDNRCGYGYYSLARNKSSKIDHVD